MNIRKMLTHDIEVITKIDHVCFPMAWSKDDYLNEILHNEYAHLYVLEIDSTIIGYIDFWITFDTCQLTKIAILPAHRGKGYAKVLMDTMILYAQKALCETISLEVRVSNTKALSLYESYGFIKVNVRKNYYQDNGEDANFLIKPLGGNLE